MNASRLAAVLFVFSVASYGIAAPDDAKGCKDSPLITRFPGSVITSCEHKDDDVVKFSMGSGKPDKKLEGEVFKNEYRYPDTASKAQVVRNIVTALRTAGFTLDYDSGDYGDYVAHVGKTWIWESVSAGHWYEQIVVIERAPTQEMTANATALTAGLKATGHAVIYGILFDSGKADIKPESAAALKEVSKVLKEDAALKVYVVGHTDNVGTLASNMELSRRRAEAIVHALETQYGIAASRLSAFGNGPYAPVASNDTEAGRALNRRVELVKQ